MFVSIFQREGSKVGVSCQTGRAFIKVILKVLPRGTSLDNSAKEFIKDYRVRV